MSSVLVIPTQPWSVTGVFGRVTELARVSQPKYNLAMSVVMGRDLDGVIVDTKETAQECIQWLRSNQVPPMTFFPLDTVRPKAGSPLSCSMVPLGHLAM